MRICQISSTFPPIKDGVGDCVAKLHRLLTLSKIDSFILTSKIIPKDEHIFNLIDTWNLIEIIKGLIFLRKKKIEIIIFQYPTSLYCRNIFVTLIPLFCRLFGLKTVLYLHEYSNYSVIGKLRILPMLFFSNFVVTSDSLNMYKIKYLKSSSKMKVISSGANFKDEIFLKKRLHKRNENDKLKIMFFGFIRSGKGLENLVELFISSKVIKEKFELNIVGSLPENFDHQSDLFFKKIKDSKNINYFGYLNEDDIQDLYSSIDVICLPFSDGLTERRGSFMTAMAFGMPVITTRPGYQIPGLNDWENIIFIEDSSYIKIENILIKLLQIDNEKLILIGNSAQKWYFNNFSENKFVDKFLEVCKKV